MMVTRGARTPRMATRGGGRAEVGAARAGHLEVAHVRVQIGARWQARGLRQVCRARWRRPAAYDALRRGRAHHLQRERNERAKPPVAPRSARRAAPRTRRRRCRAQRLSSRGQLAVPRLLRPVLLRVSVHVHGPTRGPRDSRLAKVRGTNSSLKGGSTTIKKWSQPSQKAGPPSTFVPGISKICRIRPLSCRLNPATENERGSGRKKGGGD